MVGFPAIFIISKASIELIALLSSPQTHLFRLLT